MRADLSDLIAVDGPFVSVYLASPSTDPQAADQLELRWKNARRALEDEGADDETLAAVDEFVVGERSGVARQVAGPSGEVADDVHSGNKPADRTTLAARDKRGRHRLGDTLAVVAAGGRVLVGAGLPTEPTDELDRYRLGLLPWLVPLIEADQRRFPHVVVLIDRKGADLHGYRARGDDVDDEIDEQVEGDDPVIERNAPGGGPRPATNAVPSTVGGRMPRTWSRQWREERGQHDRAAETHGRVVEALQMHMVKTLLVHDDPGDDRMAWFGPDPGHLAMQRNELEAMGVEHPEQVRLVDACVRAALGTGSDIRIVPAGELADGLGAVLRA